MYGINKNLKDILLFIADILSAKTLPIKIIERHSEQFWEDVVKLGSSELMLPAIYLNIKRKNGLHQLPKDLELYLEEITNINRKRNQKLLDEAQEVSKLLYQHQINHVFIKGIAILARDAHNDLGERMIGDIDILIEQQKIDLAFNILKDYGYNKLIEFNYKKIGYRHYPRQIHGERFGAIELHSSYLNKNHKLPVSNQHIILNKTYSNQIPVPSVEDAIWITIFTTQYNDRLQYVPKVKLRAIYDTIVLGLLENPSLKNEIENSKEGYLFSKLVSQIIPGFEPSQSSNHKIFWKTWLFSNYLNNPILFGAFFKLLVIYTEINERIELLLKNKSYRSHILKNKLLKKVS